VSLDSPYRGTDVAESLTSRLLALGLLVLVLLGTPLGAAELGSGQLEVAGARLTLSPESQTVPFDMPTRVETSLEGYDPANGVLPTTLRVRADFVGPEIEGTMVLETLPNEPFRIPRLRLEGEYRLENVRLVDGEEIVAFAEPRTAVVVVTQVLLTRVSSRPMTLDEIRNYGLVVDDDNFQALNLTFAFAIRPDREVTFDMPLVYRHYGPGGSWGPPQEFLEFPAPSLGGGSNTSRFKPPQIIPFEIEIDHPELPEIPKGGCDPRNLQCRSFHPPGPPMVGVILFPTDISLLHQFFSVVLMVQNGAPEGDPLTLEDLTARISLPPGLRQAETEPPTPLGVPVPVRVPGPDGELGTGDDLNFIVAQGSGDAEFLVEGLAEGTHVVDIDIEGLLEGLPTGLQRVTGKAQGAVVVRDPTLSVNISHPSTVRTDEQYPLYLTVSNLGTAPVNLLNLELPASRLSGVSVVGANEQTIDELLPGTSEIVEFQLVSHRTGRVVASSAKSGSAISPRFEFNVGVGNGIALSPESLVFPKATEALPQELLRPLLALAGLGHSLATAPPALDSGLPRVGQQGINERIYRVAQAGRHVDLGEPLADAAAGLALEWAGARDGDWEWDELMRSVSHGAWLASTIAGYFETAEPDPEMLFDRLAANTHYLEPWWLLAEGAELEVASRTSGKTLAGTGAWGEAGRVRELPFAELYGLTGAELAALAVPEDGGYEARLSGAAGTIDLHALLGPIGSGPGSGSRVVRWRGVSLGADDLAWVELDPAAQDLVLMIDDGGEGLVDRQVTGVEELLAPRAFEAVAAVQNPVLDPSGHVVEVLFSGDVELTSLLPRDPGRFVLPGKVSNGGLVPSEVSLGQTILGLPPVENPFEGLNNTRVVRVIFDNPVSPYKSHDLEVSDLAGVSGEAVAFQTVPVVTRVTQPGTEVEGTVIGPDGLPLGGAEVTLIEFDKSGRGNHAYCEPHSTARVTADAQGRFTFDYVRQTDCGDIFTIEAREVGTPKWGEVKGRVREVGGVQQLDVVMVGRGRVHGRVLYEDGTVPENLEVIVQNPVFESVRLAHVDDDGFYNAEDVMVGTVTLAASDDDGQVAYATFELPVAGAIVERNVTIVRTTDPTAELRGTVYELDGVTPVENAYVALYVDGNQIGVERSLADGSYDFGVVPVGIAELEAFDGETGRAGARLFVELTADQVNVQDLLLRDDRGSVEGYVYRQGTTGELTPVAGAVVWATDLAENTTTDANGYYRLDDVFAGSWSIRAADLGRGETTSATVTITSTGGVVSRDLYFVDQLPNGGITGEVLDYDGNPVQGARVHLAGGYYSTRWHHEATTNAEGRFVIPDIVPGTYGVHAISGFDGGIGFATVRFTGDTPFVTVQFRKGTIKGRTVIKNTDGSLVGVAAQIVYRHTEVITEWDLVAVARDFTTIVSGTDGYFEIPDVLIGPYEIYVYNAFHGERQAKGSLEIHGQIDEHEFVFEQNGAIHGVVLDHDGETPVAGATLELTGNQFQQYDLVSDEEGKFTFELVPPGYYAIEAHSEQGVVFRKARVEVRLKEFGQEVDVEVVLQKQGTVAGWVETASGDPVPGAVVTLKESSFPWRRIVHNADGEGSFSFDNVFAGDVSVSAQAPSLGGLGGKAASAISTEAEEVTVPIVLEPTGEITGVVTNPETGEVVPSAQVQIYRSSLFDSLTTDGEGGFRFRLLPVGFYQVRAFDPSTGRHGRSAWVEVAANGDVIAADVVLEVRGVVEGHLYDAPANTPVPGVTVVLQSKGLKWFKTYASTGVDGAFEFGGIPEGEFVISARGPDERRRARAEGEILEEDTIVVQDLYLEAEGRVIGQVLNPPGSPAGLFPNVNVRLVQSGQTVDATLDNPFELWGTLPRRSHVLLVDEIGGLHRARASVPRIEEGGGDVVMDVQIEAIGSVTVSVYDSFGNPVPGADAYVANWHDYLVGQFTSFAASTGADHQVSFDDLRQGRVTARATHPTNGLRGSTTARLDLEGQNLELRVDLQPSGWVTGQVFLSDGVTLATDAVVALEIGGKEYVSYTDENGEFEFSSIPMGSYQLLLQDVYGPGSLERFGSLAANGETDDLALVLDDANPQVLSISPATGTRDLPLATPVVIDFSEPIDKSRWKSHWVRLRKLSTGGNVGYSTVWSEGDTRLTLTATLQSGTGYDVTVHADVLDLAGRHMDWQVRSTFYTADVIPPSVIDVLPRDGQNQVPVTTDVQINFSEPIELASLSGTALELYDLTAGAGVTTTFQLLPGERVARLTPTAGLQPDRQMRITVQGARDLAGNTMAAPVVTTFWTPDETPPQLTWLTPAEGATFTAGDTVPATVDATDNRGMERVDFDVAGWSFTDSATPFGQDFPAPYVASASSVDVTATAHDVFGNTTTAARTITVEPLINANAPEIGFTCFRDGDHVVAGEELVLAIAASDDQAIESYRLFVDGVEYEVRTPINQPQVSSSFTWTPPASAAPGTTFVLRLEARDFAGNVGSQEVTFEVPPALLVGDQALTGITAGQDLYLSQGLFTLEGPLELGELVLLQGAELVADAAGAVDLSATGQVRVQCGAAIDATAGGHAGGELGHPEGYAPSWAAGAPLQTGGSHGGLGIHGEEAPSPADVYGSVYLPHHGGAGGGLYQADDKVGAAGGGKIAISASTVVVEGEIRARGGSAGGANSGAGAGGSIHLVATSLTGRGKIDASGGQTSSAGCANFDWNSGSGGGGRISIDVGTFDHFDPWAQAIAHGGLQDRCYSAVAWAGPGTVLVKTAADTYGTLQVDSGVDTSTELVPVTPLPELGADSLLSLTAAGLDAWAEASADFLPRWLGAWMVLEDAAGESLGSFRVVDLDAQGRALLEGAGAVSGAVAYHGEYRFDVIELRRRAGLVAADPIEGATMVLTDDAELSGQIVATDLVLRSGATIRPAAGSSLHFTVGNTMTVEAGALIDVTGLGYAGGNASHPEGWAPSWVAGAPAGFGGSHGGTGISAEQSPSPAEVFGSVYVPRLGGGGGARRVGHDENAGVAGGGAITIDAGTLVLDGEIRALGAESFGPSGAGGSVYVSAGVLGGAGLIDASGGRGRGGNCGLNTWLEYDGVAGGGGRVGIDVGTLSGFDPLTQVKVFGGLQDNCWNVDNWAGPGTLWVRTSAGPYGTLYVDTGVDDPEELIPATRLPELGTGSITAFEIAGADAWVTAAAVFRPRWEGAWMTLLDAGGVSLGSFELGELDAAGRALLEGAGAVVGAASYRGQYRFDAVETHRGAEVIASDPFGGVLEFTSDAAVTGEITADEVIVRSGVRVTPAAGGDLRFKVTGTFTVEAGASLDATGNGYPGGTDNTLPGGSPPWATGSYTPMGGSHAGVGVALTYGTQVGPAGEIYGSVYQPILGGGGGSEWNTTGGGGGGVIDVEAGEVVVEGEIVARGASIDVATSAAAGAGGSIWVRTGRLSGSGLIDASGGDGGQANCPSFHNWPTSGAGGGGRIALEAGELAGFDPASQARAWGGAYSCGGQVALHGGAGTVLVRTGAQTWGDLTIDNGEDAGVDRVGPMTELLALGTGTVSSTEDAGADLWIAAATPFRPRWLGAGVELLGADGSSLGVFKAVEVDAQDRLRLEGAAGLVPASYVGEYRFDNVYLRNAAELHVPLEPGEKIEVTGTLDVGLEARLDATGRGFQGGHSGHTDGYAPTGVTTSATDAGGSHGGLGTTANDPGPAGEVYGSVYFPGLEGAGGSANIDDWPVGAKGGGLIHLEVGELVVDGELAARGQTLYESSHGAGGGGGTIFIDAGTIRGAGTISAEGGGYTSCYGGGRFSGGGGGGRVALYADLFDGFDPAAQVTAAGGLAYRCINNPQNHHYGGAGTIYVSTPTSTWGDLTIRQTTGVAGPIAQTPLPSIGRGTVGVVEIDTDDPAALWIEPLDPATTFALGVQGMWVRISGTDYRVIAESADRRRLLLAGAAGTVSVGDAYLGVYKFDSINVEGGAQLVFRDESEAASTSVDGSSSLTEFDIEPPVLSLTEPAEGTVVISGQTISMTALATDNVTVTEVRFTFDGTTFVDTETPYTWSVTAPPVAVTTSYDLVVEALDGENNTTSITRAVQVDPIPLGDPPAMAIDCPSAGALLAPGTGLDLEVEASDDDGIERVELYLDGEVTPSQTLTTAPYTFRIDASPTALDGDVITARVVARDFSTASSETTLTIGVVAGQVVTANTTLSAGDTSWDGQSVIVAGGTLTVDGAHTFRDLVVLEGATLTHPATTATDTASLDLALSRDLYVGCGAEIDTDGRGYLGANPAYGYPNATAEGAASGVGGSHGGRGGHFDGTGRTYGNLFDPADPGAGGGGGSAGGGVVRIAAVGDMVIDGGVTARGGGEGQNTPHGAGGSIRLDAASLGGGGSIDASGAGSTTTAAGGGGGRVAIYGTSIDAGLLGRTRVTGGESSSSAGRGAAGTIFTKTDAQTLGELTIDNRGLVSDQLTEILGVGYGVVDALTANGFTDADAEFFHSLVGVEVAFDDNLAALWPIIGHAHRGQSLELDTAQPLTAQVGDTYEGVYRFDRFVVRGSAQVMSTDRVEAPSGAEIEAGSSWQGEVALSFALTAPADGTAFTSGDSLTAAATATDPFGIVRVDFTFDGQTITATTAPFSADFSVPIVSQPTDYEIVAELLDFSGRTLRRTVEVTAEPIFDPNAPVVVLGECPTPGDGDVVAPGQALTWEFTATDNEAVESYRLTVDGVEHQAVSTNAASVSASLAWTVPAGATAGTVYDVRVEARDFGGGVGYAQTYLTVTPGLYLTGTQSLTAAMVDGQVLTLGAGTFTAAEPLAPASLAVMSGATVLGTAGQPLEITSAGEIYVQCGGLIDAYALGYAGGTSADTSGGAPAWVGASAPDAGGSHGGVGAAWNTSGPVGETYGSVYAPRLSGGGGARDDDGSGDGYPGGGVVDLAAASMRIDGEVKARGHVNDNAGRAAGAAGSILITTGPFDGRGDLINVGGWSRSCSGSRNVGSGGGGRIALHATSLGSFDPPTQMNAAGGSRVNCSWSPYGYAAPGTAYVETPEWPRGWLMVRNGRESNGDLRDGPATDLPPLGAGAVTVVEIAGADAWVSAVSDFLPRWELAWMVLEDAAGTELGVFRVVEIDETGRALLGDAATVAGSATAYEGRYRFSRIDLFDAGGLTATDVVESDEMSLSDVVKLYGEYRVSGDIDVAVDGKVFAPPEFVPGVIRLVAGGRFTLGTGGQIHTYGRGLSGGTSSHPEGYAPDGITGSSPDSGGSHGGTGSWWDIAGTPGETYGSVYVPQLAGAGGSYDNDSNGGDGARGGGVLHIEGDEVVIDGELNARGSHSNNTGNPTGAGGSVVVRAAQLSGSGSITVTGGWMRSCSSTANVGAGGGGRVAIHADQLVGFDPATQAIAWGGSRANCSWSIHSWGGVGTIYVETAAMPQGWLLIDPGQESNGTLHETTPTVLPTLGTGAVAGHEISGADAWVNAATPFKTRWWGAWMALLDAQGTELGSFRVLRLDDAGRALLSGAASVVSSAASYRGEYRFDKVELKNGGSLVAGDPTVVAELVTEGGIAEIDGDFQLADATVKTGSELRPAQGSTLDLQLSGRLTVESGATISVNHVGYAGGTAAHPNGFGPPGVNTSAPDAGGSHGARGTGWYSDDPVGEVYDSVYSPIYAGSGGSLDDDGSGNGRYGGGILRVAAAEIVLDGQVLGHGSDSNNIGGPAGAGGTLVIETGQLSGTGVISAQGGYARSCGSTNNVGSGGGGRIAIYADQLVGFDPVTQIFSIGNAKYSCSWSAYGWAGSGTIYVKTLSDTYGRLYLDTYQGTTTNVGLTDLPELGTGTVGTVSADVDSPQDLWIEPSDPLQTFAIGVTGMWVRIGGIDYRVIDQTADRRQLLLEGAAGTVVGGESFEGVYKFDEATVKGGARLEFKDTAEVGTWTIDPGASVTTPSGNP